MTTYIPENVLSIAFSAEVSNDGRARFRVAGMPIAYNFFITDLSICVSFMLNFMPISYLA